MKIDFEVEYVRRQVIRPAVGVMDIMGRLRPLELRACQRLYSISFTRIPLRIINIPPPSELLPLVGCRLDRKSSKIHCLWDLLSFA